MKKTKKENGLLLSLFIPQYDELSLFSMSYIIILLALFNTSMSIWNFSSWSAEPKVFLIIIPFLIGMILCMYHAFTDRKKTDLEKKLMIFFAAMLNGFIGIWYGTYVIAHNPGWGLAPFPILNIISGAILIGSLRSDPDIGLAQK